MSDLVFADFGIEIIKRNGVSYIRYDAGHIVVQMREDSVSEAEATQAMRSEKDAYQVLLLVQSRLVASGVDPYVCNIAKP